MGNVLDHAIICVMVSTIQETDRLYQCCKCCSRSAFAIEELFLCLRARDTREAGYAQTPEGVIGLGDDRIYFGRYEANIATTRNSAWIVRAPAAIVLDGR